MISFWVSWFILGAFFIGISRVKKFRRKKYLTVNDVGLFLLGTIGGYVTVISLSIEPICDFFVRFGEKKIIGKQNR